MDFYEKVKGFILEPSKTFDATKEDTLEDALKYYVGITAIFSAISVRIKSLSKVISGRQVFPIMTATCPPSFKVFKMFCKDNFIS